MESTDPFEIPTSSQWVDVNLRWNASEYGGVADLRIPPWRIWKPDVLMYNRREVRRHVPHQCCGAQQWQLHLHPPGHLQEHVQDRHHLVPLRRSALQDEIRIVDLRRKPHRSAAVFRERRRSVHLHHQRRVGAYR
ncbi:hypothetical protein CEXT_612091 [Caerostris extrusa]|uniref:Neurotransmitter-gated ion-channel ligand-binding domain-containing protein n=1 Tax=Caerostris extrusa TaxID=172846 RepID=A0AAV4SWL3_CAEEX|nr:hypothetical protein CEXT_612091 [Caerostris extrusa]